MNNEILVIDIETTGFLGAGGKIVEIGIVSLNLETGEKEILFDNVCRESDMQSHEIANAWIVRNSDLTAEEVMNAELLDGYKEEIQTIIDRYPNGATAYNRSFDVDFLHSRGIKFPKLLPCPMLVSANICCIPSRRGYKWPKVQEAFDFFYPDNEYVEKHRGADDAYHEADIIKALYDRGSFQLN